MEDCDHFVKDSTVNLLLLIKDPYFLLSLLLTKQQIRVDVGLSLSTYHGLCLHPDVRPTWHSKDAHGGIA